MNYTFIISICYAQRTYTVAPDPTTVYISRLMKTVATICSK